MIKDMCSNCYTCNVYRNNNTKEEPIPHEIFDLPWYKVGMDMYEFENHHYILIVDYYSKYIEIALCKNTSSSEVITKVKSIFARHGIPSVVVSDNGPQFSSTMFKEFSLSYDFKHVTSSPRYPQSNGEAEASVKTIKNILKKCHHDGSDPYIALLNLRNTPKTFGPSPAQLLFNRQLRTRIPVHNKLLKPKIHKYDTTIFNKYREGQRQHYNKGCRSKRENLSVNQRIMFKKTDTDVWTPGVIKCKNIEPRSYNVIDDRGVEYRRNRIHINEAPNNVKNVHTNNINSPCTPSSRNSFTDLLVVPTGSPNINNNSLTNELVDVPNSSLNVNNHSTNQSLVVNSSLSTRGGRVRQRPLWLKDYVTDK